MSTIQATNIKSAASASNNIVLDASGNATFAGTAAMASSFLRNRIINGGMEIWQRGTSGFATSAGTYTADRWRNDQIITVARSSDAPTGFRFSFDVTQLAGSFGTFGQRIESVNSQDLVGQRVTVSFWAKSVSGSVGLNTILRYANSADDFNSATNIQTINLTGSPSSSWTYYTATFNSLPSQAANGLEFLIYRDLGAAQTRYAGVQLEVGTVATPFERRQFGQELALCQRYYERSDSINTSLFWCGNTTAGVTYYFPVKYAVTKRATATVSFSNVTNAGFPNTITAGEQSSVGFRADSTSDAATSAGYFRSNWAASAEL